MGCTSCPPEVKQLDLQLLLQLSAPAADPESGDLPPHVIAGDFYTTRRGRFFRE